MSAKDFIVLHFQVGIDRHIYLPITPSTVHTIQVSCNFDTDSYSIYLNGFELLSKLPG